MDKRLTNLVERACRTRYGFADILAAADEVFEKQTDAASLRTAKALLTHEMYQPRCLATFILGRLAVSPTENLEILRTEISFDQSWQVHEFLAKAFNRYCSDIGYHNALPTIKVWLADPNPNVRRAVTEGLRRWTSRSYFCDHPVEAIRLLSQFKDDDSEYLRKSVGNALRDISRKFPTLVEDELQNWDQTNSKIKQTYRLAGKALVHL